MIIIKGSAVAPGVGIGPAAGGAQPVKDKSGPAITVLVCRDLDALRLDDYPAGSIGVVAAETGSRDSGAAGLLRSRGIPAVVGLNRLLESVRDGDTVIVDGQSGNFAISRMSAPFFLTSAYRRDMR